MVCHRGVFSCEDAISVFFEPFIEGSVCFTYVHLGAEGTVEDVDHILGLAGKVGFNVEGVTGQPLHSGRWIQKVTGFTFCFFALEVAWLG